jgi:hypothetical protein
MYLHLQFLVLLLLLTLLYTCSFDRHALDLLEKMLTLDPSQVCYFSKVVYFGTKCYMSNYVNDKYMVS